MERRQQPDQKRRKIADSAQPQNVQHVSPNSPFPTSPVPSGFNLADISIHRPGEQISSASSQNTEIVPSTQSASEINASLQQEDTFQDQRYPLLHARFIKKLGAKKVYEADGVRFIPNDEVPLFLDADQYEQGKVVPADMSRWVGNQDQNAYFSPQHGEDRNPQFRAIEDNDKEDGLLDEPQLEEFREYEDFLKAARDEGLSVEDVIARAEGEKGWVNDNHWLRLKSLLIGMEKKHPIPPVNLKRGSDTPIRDGRHTILAAMFHGYKQVPVRYV
jgi:hypothetical protein